MDTNARKNRSGTANEWLVQSIFDKYNIESISQHTMDNIYNDKKLTKKFDFYFELKGKKYCVESNFFSTSGSKIDSTVGQYISLQENITRNTDYEFIWITYGPLWRKSASYIKQLIRFSENSEGLHNLYSFKKWIKENSLNK